ncbi:hypothetical protein ACFWDI_01045 [Streptomyces sp. NPDC060064]|uniref:hypothetical protein n=1 Tax=Streptomyces sp. NPDC060064 TaxID=3347049 RepID=UPI003690EE22
MAFSINPHTGLDGIEFGESQEDLRSRLGNPKSFKRNPSTETVTDHFVELGLLLSYNSEGRLEFIEVTPAAEVTFNGVGLIGRPLNEVVTELASHGAYGESDSFGAEFTQSGFSLFAPNVDADETAIVEGVSVFPRGYYG